MAPELSVTRLIGMLKGGDGEAAQRLWEVYFGRLVALARAKLRGVATRAADEEDVALSAFDSLCRRAEAVHFPRLADRDDLWQLLFVITVRKAPNLVRHEGRFPRPEQGPRASQTRRNSDADGYFRSRVHSLNYAAQMISGRTPSPPRRPGR